MPYPCPMFLYEFEELKMTSMQETKAELTLDHFGNDPITRVENALSGLREGNGVVVLDDESRENEADLIYSSDHLTEKQMALMIRECSVDIGIVYGNEKNAKGRTTPVAREIDFIAASGGKKTYIQSAYALGTEEKAITENKPFALTGDSFPKIIVRHDIRKRWYDDNGILNVGVIDFLLDDTLV